jgi:hypothetical protein
LGRDELTVRVLIDLRDYLADSMQQERTLATVGGTFGGLIVFLTGISLDAFDTFDEA